MPYDYMRTPVTERIASLIRTRPDRGKRLSAAADTVGCFACMDTGKQWDARGHQMAWLDGHGNYDVVHCSGCKGGGYIHPTNAIAGMFKRGDVSDVDGRIAILETIAAEMAREEQVRKDAEAEAAQEVYESKPTPLWAFAKHDTVVETCKAADVDIALGELAKKLAQAIRSVNGDLAGLGQLVRTATLKINVGSMESGKSHREVSRTDVDKWRNATYAIVDVHRRDYSANGWCCIPACRCKISMVELRATYKVLRPRNQAARDKCDELLANRIDEIIDLRSASPV